MYAIVTVGDNEYTVDTADTKEEALSVADVWTKRTHRLHVVKADK